MPRTPGPKAQLIKSQKEKFLDPILRGEIFLNRKYRAGIVFRCAAVTFADQMHREN